jgi:mono/diheme cytochrome c family protein
VKLRRAIITWSIFGLFVAYTFNACAPENSELALSSQAERCSNALLENGFTAYHAVLNSKCAGCHIQGGAGNGGFADPNIQVAYNVFRAKGETLIYNYAIDGAHRPPSSGPANIPLLEAPRAEWNAAWPAYEACMATPVDPVDPTDPTDPTDPNPPPPPPPPGTGLVTPTIKTVAKNLPAAASAATNIVWQLGSEMEDNTKTQAGATLTITVQAITTQQGNSAYYISVPRLRGANAGSLYVKNLGFYLDDVFVPAPAGATFQSVDRYIPQAGTRDLAPSGGAMVIALPTLAGHRIAPAFERFEQAVVGGTPLVFNPPTHTQLNSATDPQRVFNSKCSSCHGATNPRAGLNLLNYYGVFGIYVIPFVPNSSPLFTRITARTMPPAGSPQLTAAEIESVRQWILDGAPR